MRYDINNSDRYYNPSRQTNPPPKVGLRAPEWTERSLALVTSHRAYPASLRLSPHGTPRQNRCPAFDFLQALQVRVRRV
jgi:hypothetical protein